MPETTTIAIVTLLAATLRVATPLLFAALGETLVERAGVLNLGIEGTMFLGAMAGFVAAYFSGSLWVGVLTACLVGALAGLLMALLAVYLGVNQHVAGIGLTLLTTGLALYLFRIIFGEQQVPPKITPFPQLSLGSWLGPLAPIFEQYGLTYLALLLVPALWWLLNRTHFGLQVRAVGENPAAADVAGVNVFRTRLFALAIGGALMGLGGAFLSLAQLGAFTFGIISGRGWVAIALVIFGNWSPLKVLGGALLFGGFQALQLRLQASGFQLPYQALLALPYLVTIAALALAGRNVSAPSALLKPYRREA
ncbi:MAG: ABC transporter permease [Chloroflexi bacterium]|nr:ABC transporter permease [Chloroflexota bacterium]